MSSTTPVQSVTFDVNDCQIAPLLTDEIAAANPTYSAWQDVPGIQQVQVNPAFITAELKGDAKTLDTRAKTSQIDITANYALSDLSLLKALLGGTLVNTATSAKWTLLGTNSIPYVRFAFSIDDTSTGIGNIVVVVNKAKLSGGNLFDQQTDQYGSRSIQLTGIAPLSNDEMLKVDYYVAKTSISTAYTITP